ncbi:hypothetical protein LTR99_005328 [Exophiala xenobiotica]|uniref:Stress-response A/B barrel domain-containing protein n=1 Tax=Vermiconidia calcicola TaxID=1690605 RepID=A0AAV9Q4Y3_9PEZI|nr:hypothetical protein LTR99_005328 [Exophiala xenobiotica]KAK5436669.1 hypothetical protein LTR34_002300 [Exophiala xenobiotica]KAK5535914.1 hypothetical protein LTR25_005816 [Vermiconidia calcicola]KAK5548855.1 hypothetical protein LTR23_001344 [Chaetothyriales sp. CCFEE 6169]
MTTTTTTPNVFVRVSPKPGKEARVAELAEFVLKQVQANEPWVSMYRVYTAKSLKGKGDGDGDDIVHYFIEFRIDDMSKLATRREMPHHRTIAKAFEEEDLLSEPLGYSLLEEKGAWMR